MRTSVTPSAPWATLKAEIDIYAETDSSINIVWKPSNSNIKLIADTSAEPFTFSSQVYARRVG